MNLGFYTILIAQFLSALADNALFIAAVALLTQMNAPAEQHSLLLHFFALFYVLLAPFVGAVSDAIPKSRLMLICNGIKCLGCLSMLFGLHPLAAYAIVGFGAAAYSPAKYGIVTEYLPAEKLVQANGWLEGSTVMAIIFGTVLGGFLVASGNAGFSAWFLEAFSSVNLFHGLSVPQIGIIAIIGLYASAGLFNLFIPKMHIHYPKQHVNPIPLMRDFWHFVLVLWRDRRAQLTLAVTTLFWGVGATMRLVVLDWGKWYLGLTLQESTYLIATVAIGTALGAGLAGVFVPLKKAFRVLPAGIIMGLVVFSMLFVTNLYLAGVLMFFVGGLGGFFVVPLNAVLQNRGQILMSAGKSIAIQNFNEHIGILVMVGLHATLVATGSIGNRPPMATIIVGLGSLVAVVMSIIYWQYRKQQADLESMG
jgi:MFS family permease